jgi:hypothetical protein
VPGQVGGRSRGCGGGHVHVRGGVEAGDVGEVEVGRLDVGDVGAGVEGLVFRAVEVGSVLQLDGGVCARGDVRRRAGDVQARVAWIYFPDGDGVEDVGEVRLRFRV